MTWLILRYLLAAPFALLWAICLTGNTWLLITSLASRPSRPVPTPLGVIGLISGLVAAFCSPLILFVDWRCLLLLCVLPEVPALLLVLLRVIRPDPPATIL